MAFEGYSLRARQVIFVARHIAGRRGSALVHLDHVLLAVLYEDQGDISKALSGAPELQHLAALPVVELHDHFFPAQRASDLIRRLEDALPSADALPATAEIPMSPGVKKMLGVAGELAGRLGQSQVHPMHLLAAILAQGSSLGAALLLEAGLSQDKVAEAIPRFSQPP